MGDPMTRLLIALGFDPIAFVVSFVLALAATALTVFMLSAPARGRLWAAAFLLVGGTLLLADPVHAQRQEPAVVILCASGGVSRLNDGGFLASGGTCVLHDREGGHTSAGSIVVYDSSLGSP
jgi:hypothetical protein